MLVNRPVRGLRHKFILCKHRCKHAVKILCGVRRILKVFLFSQHYTMGNFLTLRGDGPSGFPVPTPMAMDIVSNLGTPTHFHKSTQLFMMVGARGLH